MLAIDTQTYLQLLLLNVGMTLLALGNSIGDYIQDIAAAKNNRANMAITACFGGPLLNLLFGTGLGFLFLLGKT